MDGYTLTLSHPHSGWDGTHGAMLQVMAGVIEQDGPVDAALTYWDTKAQANVSVVGQWLTFSHEKGIRFAVDGTQLRVDIENVIEVSI